MSDFKKHPYIPWYMSDWLNDPNLKLLDPAAKGFWMDLLCQMALFFPYGHCSKLSHTKLKKAKVEGLKNISVKNLVNQTVNGGDDIQVELSLRLSVEEQLKLSDNMEDKLHIFLPYTQEQVSTYLKILEDNGIFSRTDDGIIYSRRLVKDYRKRVQAYKNGKGGGNPNLKKGNGQKSKSSSSPSNGRSVNNLVNQNLNQGVGNSENHFLDNETDPENDSNKLVDGSMIVGGSQGEGREGEESPPEFPMQQLYEKPFEEVSKLKLFKKLKEPDFDNWRAFVDFIRSKPYLVQIFRVKFVNPADFAQIVKEKNFTKDKWEPVIRRIISSGLDPEKHNLFFRIPQFHDYVYPPGKTNGSTGGGSLSTGGGDLDSDDWTT
jgi:hypothetical protein